MAGIFTCIIRVYYINFIDPGTCDCRFNCVNFKLNMGIDIFIIQVIITLE